MAYSNVETPVFYIDNYLYHKAIETSFTEGTPSDAYNMSPQVSTGISSDFDIQLPISPINYDLSGNMKYYIALLNNDLPSRGYFANMSTLISDENNVYVYNDFDLIKGGWNTYSFHHGSTILATDTAHDTSFYKLNNYGWFQLGAVSTGIQYTMPKNPDLNLSMEIEMGGVDAVVTSNGDTISNIKYEGSPLWTNTDFWGESGLRITNPFETYFINWTPSYPSIDVRKNGTKRSGRKKWALSFSYISDTDFFSSNVKSSNYTEHGFENDTEYSSNDVDTTNNTLRYNMDTDDSFYAQVWNKTLGGALPFIFQPDSNDKDDFYICKFDQKSLKVSQSAYKVYDISLKIVESW